MSLITISGPSGAGKSTLMNFLKHEYNAQLLPSWTTRPKRENTFNDDIYIHLSRKEYLEKLKQNHFLLNEQVAGNYYGSATKDIYNSITLPNPWLSDLTAHSVIELIELGYKPTACIVIMISENLSLKRMESRGDSESQIEKRIQRYKIEKDDCEKLVLRIPETIYLDGSDSEKIIQTKSCNLLCTILGR